MTLKNNRAPLLGNIKLYASFHHHMWIQTGVTVRKRLSWVVTSVTLTFDLWPWPFAWTLRWSLVITPENFKMIRWWEHSQKGVTDRRTDGQMDRQTENTICRAAWSQLIRSISWDRYHPREWLHRIWLGFHHEDQKKATGYKWIQEPCWVRVGWCWGAKSEWPGGGGGGWGGGGVIRDGIHCSLTKS